MHRPAVRECHAWKLLSLACRGRLLVLHEGVCLMTAHTRLCKSRTPTPWSPGGDRQHHRPCSLPKGSHNVPQRSRSRVDRVFGNHNSPPRIMEVISKVRTGDPDPEHISTSFVERQNLTMRMAIRRFTRLTNAFSKKLLNLKAAVALHFAYYNFCRVHSSLRVTPAMESGISDHIWTIGELLA